MDISMVLNALEEEKHNTKTEWQLQKAVLLPSMRTQPPMGTYPHDTTSSYDRCFGLLDCLGLASNDMSRPHKKDQPSAPFTGFQNLPTHKKNQPSAPFTSFQNLPTHKQNQPSAPFTGFQNLPTHKQNQPSAPFTGFQHLPTLGKDLPSTLGKDQPSTHGKDQPSTLGKDQPSAPFTGFQPLTDGTTYGKGQNLPTHKQNQPSAPFTGFQNLPTHKQNQPSAPFTGFQNLPTHKQSQPSAPFTGFQPLTDGAVNGKGQPLPTHDAGQPSAPFTGFQPLTDGAVNGKGQPLPTHEQSQPSAPFPGFQYLPTLEEKSRPHGKGQPSAPFTGFQHLPTLGKNQPSAPLTGFQHLRTLEENRESFVMNSSFPPEVKLPPISSLDWNYRGSNHKSWNRTGSSRIQLDAVRLNPKRSPRRASSTSPIVNRYTHRSPSHGGIQPSPKLPRLLYTRPQPEDDAVHVVDTEYDAPPRSSCNRPYNRAQIDWIRYFKVDLSISYDSMDKPFAVQWPGESKTGHCFSARLYRDNWMPRVDAANNPMYDEKGKVKMDAAKMREMKTQEGKEKCIPYSLVDRYPWRAVEYQWIREEDKERARAILSGDDPNDPTGSK